MNRMFAPAASKRLRGVLESAFEFPVVFLLSHAMARFPRLISSMMIDNIEV